MSLKKEVGLFFLAVFYFVIATNTQTGWLFVLSSFLFGLLGISWSLSRRSLGGLKVEQTCTGEPQRGNSLRIAVSLSNLGKKALQEIKVESSTPPWAAQSPPFEWAIPGLASSETAKCQRVLVPLLRGEHPLPEIQVIYGAPFGLFTTARSLPSEQSILVYPEIEKLPTTRSKSRLTTTLGELTSPTGLGDTSILRSVREYTPGDDLRHVHWKASAKRSPQLPLLVKEHHAPSPAQVLLLLDTSAQGTVGEQPLFLFERAVSFTASILWSAHRKGIRSGLVLREASGQWTLFRHWSRQYRALAKITHDNDLGLQTWGGEIEAMRAKVLGKEFSGAKPGLISAGLSKDSSSHLSPWFAKVFWLTDPNLSAPFPNHPGLIQLDGTKSGFPEVSSYV